jgi:hypothetical protein
MLAVAPASASSSSSANWASSSAAPNRPSSSASLRSPLISVRSLWAWGSEGRGYGRFEVGKSWEDGVQGLERGASAAH